MLDPSAPSIGGVRFAGVERSLDELYQATVVGDADAFDELYTRLKDLVWWTIRNTGVFGADAEDIFQNTWAKFFEYLGRHRNPSALKGWLVAVARNACIDAGRVSGRTVSDEVLFAIASDDVPPDDQAILGLDIDTLDAVLLELEEPQRQLVALWANRASYQEINAVLGMPSGSVGPTMARIRSRIAARMKELS